MASDREILNILSVAPEHLGSWGLNWSYKQQKQMSCCTWIKDQHGIVPSSISNPIQKL